MTALITATIATVSLAGLVWLTVLGLQGDRQDV